VELKKVGLAKLSFLREFNLALPSSAKNKTISFSQVTLFLQF